ncbi:MAG: hypothetical protein IJO70_11960 [Lachnospiraceae bacterium]|nr:hypothetical protein [Lachnospiraceae bacterium]
MKRLFRKENRIARVIALLLVAIMVLTPLYQHSGLKKPTKAAENFTISHTVEKDLGAKTITKTEKVPDPDNAPDDKTVTYNAEPIAKPADGDIPRIHYYRNENWNLTFNISRSITVALQYADAAVTDYSMVGAVYGSYGEVEEIKTSAPTEATTAWNGSYYAIYVKVNDDAFPLDEENGETDCENNWTLQAVYKIEEHTKLSEGDLWVTADPNYTGDGSIMSKASINKSATILGKLVSERDDVLVGAVGFFYEKTPNTAFDTSYQPKPEDKILGSEDGEDGTYQIWLGYQYGTSFVVYDTESIDTVVIDTKAPSLVEESKLLHQYDGQPAINADGGKKYIDASAYDYGIYYRYQFKVNDDNLPSELMVKAVQVDGGKSFDHKAKKGADNTYTIDYLAKDGNGESGSVGMEADEEYQLVLTLVDTAGNPDGGSEIVLDTIKVVDYNLRLTDISIKHDEDIETVGDIITKPNTEENPNQTSKTAKIDLPSTETNKKQTLKATIVSGYPITSVVLKGKQQPNGQQEYDLVINKTTTVEKKDGLYTYPIEYVLPENSNTRIKYSDMSLEVKDNNGRTIVLEINDEIQYDDVPPDVKSLSAFKKPGGQTEEINVEDILSDGYIVIADDKNSEDVYKFNFSITDDSGEAIVAKVYFGDDYVTSRGTLRKDIRGIYYTEIESSVIHEYLKDNALDSMFVKVIAEDNVGNASQPVSATYPVMLTDKKIKVSGTLVKGTDKENSETVDLTEEFPSNTYIDNDQYMIKIEASSGYPIDKIILTGKNGKPNITVSGLSSLCYKHSTNNRWYLNEAQYITVPAGTGINDLFEDMEVTVIDVGEYDPNTDTYSVAPQEKTLKVGTMLYDSSDPEPILSEKKPGQDSYSEVTMYKDTVNVYDGSLGEYGLEAIFIPGSQTVESEIAVTEYTISGAKESGNNTTSPIAGSLGHDYEEDGENNDSKVTLTIPESADANGTVITFNVADEAGMVLPENERTVVRIVDKTDPSIGDVLINNKAPSSNPVGKNVTISAQAKDLIGLSSFSIVVKNSNGATVGTLNKTYTGTTAMNTKDTEIVMTETLNLYELADGIYYIHPVSTDRVGRVSAEKIVSFEVDGSLPVVTAAVTSGITAGNAPVVVDGKIIRDKYYSSDVTVSFTCADKHFVDEKYVKEHCIVTDNGTAVDVTWKYNDATKKWEGSYVAKANDNEEKTHTIILTAEDKSGNVAKTQQIDLVVDKKDPELTVNFDGTIYQETQGVRAVVSNPTIAISESENYKNSKGFYYELSKTVPDEPTKKGAPMQTSQRSFTYSEEAEYELKVYSYDLAGNKSEDRIIKFRVDKTAPAISVSGMSDGGSSSSPTTVNINMFELFYQNASIDVTVEVETEDGQKRAAMEPIHQQAGAKNTSVPVYLDKSGIYTINVTASDSLNADVVATYTFTIDTVPPVVTLEGVSNYDVTDKDVTIASTITENFYSTKRITVTGTTTDDAGKVTPIVIDDYSVTANPTIINKTFSADGIYDLTITCVDIVGNSDSKSVHFTIDKGAPVIGDLSDIDGKTLTSFSWDKDLDELVSDLTVCDVHMYLNGQEYYGDEELEDGSYVLLITAEDELGHKTEKEVKFTLDTKKPVFIVTGVEKDEKKLEPYSITVSLQLDEDKLTSVTLNGEVVTITNNQATIEITEVGEYKLYMEAVDEAGNVSSDEYEFKLISEAEQNFWIILAILAAVAVLIIIILLARRRKKNN